MIDEDFFISASSLAAPFAGLTRTDSPRYQARLPRDRAACAGVVELVDAPDSKARHSRQFY